MVRLLLRVESGPSGNMLCWRERERRKKGKKKGVEDEGRSRRGKE